MWAINVRKIQEIQKQSSGRPVGGKQYRVSSIGYVVKKGKEMQGEIQKIQDANTVMSDM